MKHHLAPEAAASETVGSYLALAVNAIPPAWPLTSSVAVNPFIGQSTSDFAEAVALIRRVAGCALTPPREEFARLIASGRLTDDVLEAALEVCPHAGKPSGIADLTTAMFESREAPAALPTVADVVEGVTSTDWTGLIEDRIGIWAAAYFDRGQALWKLANGRGAWASWREWAINDLGAEIQGLKGFASFVAALPSDPAVAAARALQTLGITAEAADLYLHRLIMTLGGWAQYARHLQWRAELAGGSDTTAADLLTIRLVWEQALFTCHRSAIGDLWNESREQYALPVDPTMSDIIDGILQEARERAFQKELAATLSGARPVESDGRAALQAVFCIDVRSEVYRRALESLNLGITTSGMAGFFGVPVLHRPFASDVVEEHSPVIVHPGLASECTTVGSDMLRHEQSARISARLRRAWGRFRLAAVSSFAFVEASGPLYALKLLRDAIPVLRRSPVSSPAPNLAGRLDVATRATLAEGALRAMALTEDFASIVLIVGHGARVTNNPFESALQCGACGGHSGETNARLMAGILNEPDVRAELVSRGIRIPDDTLFVAALHCTTDDRVELFDCQHVGRRHADALTTTRRWLAEAGVSARAERALRLPGSGTGERIPERMLDWAEVRPEWGLAGAAAFVVARRETTRGRDLQGRVFLHEFDPDADREHGYALLEQILTAPVIVASWISLQYFGSTVAPSVFGSGNKLLHNVVGGFGVLEGGSGLLRTGLPVQSVHDGEKTAHEPLRLTVCVQAPVEAISHILENHPDVRALFDNRWLHLISMDDSGRLERRYVGGLGWEELEA